nr:alpha/beta hydrolase [Bacillus toyonensis]
MRILISMGSSVFLQRLFLYIVIFGLLLDFNPWYAVIVYISVAILSLILGIYSIVRSVRESANVTLLTIPIGVVTTLFSVVIIGFTVFAYFLPEGGIPPIIRL